MAQASSQLALSRPTSRVLTWGFRVSAALLLLGLIVTAIQGESLDTTLDGVPSLLDRTFDGEGAGIVGLGIVVMIVTPIISTLSIVLSCVRIGDRRYALITLAVLGILFISAALSAA